MEKRRRVGGEGSNRGVEENTMAILDTFGFSTTKISHHLNDDRLAFLEAVRTASLLPDNGSPPTPKMLEAIFHIMKDADSLDLIMESYQLLIGLDKRYPRVYLSKAEKSVSSSSTDILSQLVLVEEDWIPFDLAADSNKNKGEAARCSRVSVDYVDIQGFHALLQEIAKAAKEVDFKAAEMTYCRKPNGGKNWLTKFAGTDLDSCSVFLQFLPFPFMIVNFALSFCLWHEPDKHILILYVAHFNSGMCLFQFVKNMLLLQYLVNVLERDFRPRNSTFQEDMNWILLRESILNMLLGSRKTNYKALMKDCLSLMCELSQLTMFENHEDDSGEPQNETTRAVVICLPEVIKISCTALETLLVLTMELDSARQIADHKGLTTRADGVRTPVVEIILDELIYNKDILLPFLQVFNPKWKLQIIVEYFQKYIPKHPVQTRRSNVAMNTEDIGGVLKYLSERNTAKNVIKKIGSDVVQLLLAYALQASLMLSNEIISQSSSDMSDEDAKNKSVTDVCKSFISAFTCLRQEDRKSQVLSVAKEALVTAATILSSTSNGV